MMKRSLEKVQVDIPYARVTGSVARLVGLDFGFQAEGSRSEKPNRDS